MIDDQLNERIQEIADFAKGEEDKRGYGKRLPYIGWFWRDIYPSEQRITIGHCGDFVGVMMKNKWDYPARRLRPREIEIFLAMLDKAWKAHGTAELDAACDHIWQWFQTRRIGDDDDPRFDCPLEDLLPETR